MCLTRATLKRSRKELHRFVRRRRFLHRKGRYRSSAYDRCETMVAPRGARDETTAPGGGFATPCPGVAGPLNSTERQTPIAVGEPEKDGASCPSCQNDGNESRHRLFRATGVRDTQCAHVEPEEPGDRDQVCRDVELRGAVSPTLSEMAREQDPLLVLHVDLSRRTIPALEPEAPSV